MSGITNERLEAARAKAAEHLSIDLREPQQERRIAALQKLYDKYASGTDVKSLIYGDINVCCDRLIEIHGIQQKELDDLKVSDDSLLAKKIKLKNIEYKFKGEIGRLEKRISINTRLVSICDNKYSNFNDISVEHRKQLKEFEDTC